MVDFACFDLVPERLRFTLDHLSLDHSILCMDTHLLQTFAGHKQHLNSSGFSLLLIPLHLLCTHHHLHNKLRMELLPTPFLETTKENFPFPFPF